MIHLCLNIAEEDSDPLVMAFDCVYLECVTSTQLNSFILPQTVVSVTEKLK